MTSRYVLHVVNCLGETNVEFFKDYVKAYNKFNQYQTNDHTQLEIWDNYNNKRLLIWSHND